MIKEIEKNSITPLSEVQFSYLKKLVLDLSIEQLIWISGYLWGSISNKSLKKSLENVSFGESNSSYIKNYITIISASQTGNARKLAEQLYNDLFSLNLSVKLFSAGDYDYKNLKKEKVLIVIISTYGEGEPPEEAIILYKYLFSNKAPSMKNTKFIVFSLGDSSYEHFAKAGKDFDSRLEELGGCRLYNRIDADVDFHHKAEEWRKNIISLCTEKKFFNCFSKNNIKKNNQHKKDSNFYYDQKTPLIAYLSVRQKITSRSSIKDIYHLEIDISNSGLRYFPGDSVGIWYKNDPNLIKELLKLCNFTGNEMVKIRNNSIVSLYEALHEHYELTLNTFKVVKNFFDVTKCDEISNLFQDQKKLKKFIECIPIVDMFRRYSARISSQELIGILLPMKPRFYSISSAQDIVGEEIHITVGAVRYEVNGRIRFGGASSYLIDRLKENEEMKIFIGSNKNFRLPQNFDSSIVMIGAGTGIAPFRSFMQQRSLNDSSLGKNWLFFGNFRFIDDFLYQTEWQRYFRNKLLHKINTAWSRDQDYKIYVQDIMFKEKKELWSWIKDGSYIYVCGDAKKMAFDVEKMLITIISDCGKMSMESTHDFLNDMRIQRRYQRDIY